MTACGKTCAKEEEKRPLHNDHQALHVTILHALPGRLRLQYEIPVPGPGLYETINGMTACTYNPVLRTMLCCYDAQIATEKQMLMSICGTYAAQVHAPLIHVRHAEEERFSHLRLLCGGSWLDVGIFPPGSRQFFYRKDS